MSREVAELICAVGLPYLEKASNLQYLFKKLGSGKHFPGIAKGWSTLDGENPTTHEIWNKLNKKLKSGYWDSIPLNSYDEDTKLKKTELHYLLYSIFEIN